MSNRRETRVYRVHQGQEEVRYLYWAGCAGDRAGRWGEDYLWVVSGQGMRYAVEDGCGR